MNQEVRGEATVHGRDQAPFTAADLPINEDGRIYHLQVKPEQVAPDILIVGDPGRAEMIGSTFLRDLEVEHENRGLVTVTGTSEITGDRATIISPVKVSVTTSGMGTPSLEIVANELVALHEIDFQSRRRKPEFPRIHIIRVGTSGGLQASTRLGTPIITSYAIGMGNAGFYYEVPHPDETCRRLEKELARLLRDAMSASSRFYGIIRPYCARAEPTLVQALQQAASQLGVASKAGLTVSSAGFFAPQGRDISRIRPSVPDIDQLLAEYDPKLDGQQIENMEMESAFLIYLFSGLGHWAASICPAIANRRHDTFAANYQDAIRDATRVALLALANTRKRFPDALITP